MSSAAIPIYRIKPAVRKDGWCGYVVQEAKFDVVDGYLLGYDNLTEVLNRDQAELAFKHLTGGSHE